MSSSEDTCPCPATETSLVDAQVIRLHQGEAVWQIRKSWQTSLLGGTAPDWFAIHREARAESVKVGHERQTWRVTLPQGTVFAKVIDPVGLIEQWKTRLRFDSSAREWRVSRAAEARGVPVARCLAVGVSEGRPRRRVLLSEGVPGGVGLAEVWERDVASVSARRRQASAHVLIEAVARLFATAHERGFAHGDAHPDNILVLMPGSSDVSAAFVDVHSARLTRGPVSLRRAADSLAQIDQYFRRRATRTDRLRFLNAYLDSRLSMGFTASDRLSKRRFISSVLRAGAIHARRMARHWDRRLRRNGKYFATFDLGAGWRAKVVLTLERRHVFPEPDVPDRTEADWRVILQRLIGRITLTLPTDTTFAYEGLHIEVRVIGRPVVRSLTPLQRSAHRGEFERCHRLRHRDIGAHLVLAYAEHRRAGLVDITLLVRARREGAATWQPARPVNGPTGG